MPSENSSLLQLAAHRFDAPRRALIVAGFAVAASCAAWMTRMSPAVGVAALLLSGLPLLSIVLPVANPTFKIFAIEEFTHGYRLKNIVRQLTICSRRRR